MGFVVPCSKLQKFIWMTCGNLYKSLIKTPECSKSLKVCPKAQFLDLFSFLTYIIDLSLYKTRESKMAIFADDTLIMKADTRNQLNIQTDPHKIIDWFC